MDGPLGAIERYNSVLDGDRGWFPITQLRCFLSKDIEKNCSKENTVACSKMYINELFYITISLHIYDSLSIVDAPYSLEDGVFQIISVASD